MQILTAELDEYYFLCLLGFQSPFSFSFLKLEKIVVPVVTLLPDGDYEYVPTLFNHNFTVAGYPIVHDDNQVFALGPTDQVFVLPDAIQPHG